MILNRITLNTAINIVKNFGKFFININKDLFKPTQRFTLTLSQLNEIHTKLKTYRKAITEFTFTKNFKNIPNKDMYMNLRTTIRKATVAVNHAIKTLIVEKQHQYKAYSNLCYHTIDLHLFNTQRVINNLDIFK